MTCPSLLTWSLPNLYTVLVHLEAEVLIQTQNFLKQNLQSYSFFVAINSGHLIWFLIVQVWYAFCHSGNSETRLYLSYCT